MLWYFMSFCYIDTSKIKFGISKKWRFFCKSFLYLTRNSLSSRVHVNSQLLFTEKLDVSLVYWSCSSCRSSRIHLGEFQ